MRCRPRGAGGRRFPTRLALAALTLCALTASSLSGAQVRFLRLQSFDSFLPGTLEGVGIDAAGRLQLADEVERLADIEEPFLFAAAAHPEGWVLGTGNAGKVLMVDRRGEVTLLFSTLEPEVFAVWADDDGTVFVGSSPGGKVYRYRAGEAEEFFDPGETYIWALTRHADGRRLVATGTEGRLYAVSEDGRGEVLFDSDDIHLRTLKTAADGSVLLGTAGEGLILRLDPDGSARTLYDARHPEVVAFATAPDGFCYAAVLASEASMVDLTAARSAEEQQKGQGGDQGGGNGGMDGGGQGSVTLVEGEGLFTASRPAGFSGPRTEILRIAPSGVVEKIWSFQDETALAMGFFRGRLWVGTGLEGKLYSFRNEKMVLEEDVDERQVVALLPGNPGPAFATTNASAFFVVSERSERRGVYTSPTLDAGQISRFGTLTWEGEAPSGAKLRFAVRSGMSAEPDRTWSAWTAASSDAELALADLPRGRYVQWRAELEAGTQESPSLTTVSLSYRQENLAPRISSLSVMDPGQVLVPSNFNPAQQVFEPAHPNRDGIFTTLETSGTEDRRFKTLWKKGYRTLRWEAEDANNDDLDYELAFRPTRGGVGWLEIVDGLRESHYSFDSSVLPDGSYRFRLRASDRRSNPGGGDLAADQISEPVVVDHTPPTVAAVSRGDGRLEVTVTDRLLPLRQAQVSFDAGEWETARVVDGLLDSRREALVVEVPDGTELVLLRVMDGAFNHATFDLEGGEK